MVSECCSLVQLELYWVDLALSEKRDISWQCVPIFHISGNNQDQDKVKKEVVGCEKSFVQHSKMRGSDC